MKLPVFWTEPASSQLADIFSYISESNADAAESQIGLVANAVSNLAEFSAMGRPGRRRGTRELVVPGTPYVVAYRIRLATIEILAVIHGARRWPGKFDL